MCRLILFFPTPAVALVAADDAAPFSSPVAFDVAPGVIEEVSVVNISK